MEMCNWVVDGKVRGTEIPLERVVGCLQSGMDRAALLVQFPDLPEDSLGELRTWALIDTLMRSIEGLSATLRGRKCLPPGDS